MSALAGLQDIVDYIQEKSAKGAAPVEKTQKPIENWQEILYKEFPDSVKRDRLNRMFAASGVYKDVTSSDLGPVRIVSLYPIIAQIVNLETKFLNILKQKAPYRCTDFQTRIPEENIGSDQLQPFNMDGNLPPVTQSILSERTNTLTAIGQQISVSFMASELAAQSPYRRDELAAQLAKAMIRIDRTMNSLLLSSVEQTSEAVPNVPQLHGFVTASTANVQATGGSNLTDIFISTAVNQQAAYFGYDQLTDLVALTNNTQTSVVRNLMINRYPGNQPMSKLQYDTELAARVAKVGVPVQMMYEDNNQVAIPFIREMQLPAGTTILFRSSLPSLGKFQMQGQFGGFVVERPITNLYRLDVCFDIFTLVDPLVVSRSLITGHP